MNLLWQPLALFAPVARHLGDALGARLLDGRADRRASAARSLPRRGRLWSPAPATDCASPAAAARVFAHQARRLSVDCMALQCGRNEAH